MCRGWSQHQPPPSPTCRPAQQSWQFTTGQSTVWTERVKRPKAPWNCGLQSWTLRWSVLPPSRWPEWYNGKLSPMANYLQTSQVHPTKTSSTIWRTSSEPWAFLRSSTSYENQSCPKQRERKRLETSSILFHGQKLRSRTSATLSLILNGAVSASLISPSSFGLFGMQVQHQTSTHAGNILSSYGNPCKLDPVQVYATCMCLPKRKAKENGHCQKSCQGFWRLFGKGRMFGRPFFKTNPQELSTLCIYPIKRLNNTKNVSINKILSITNFAHDFYPAALKEHPINIH